MKSLLLISALLIVFACNMNKNKDQTTQSADSLNNNSIGIDDRVQDSIILCFEQKKVNISKTDTTTITNSITLKMKGNDISGNFAEVIEGKFSESYGGKIKGIKENDILKLKFITDMGGGEESQDHEFRLDGEKLIEKSIKSSDKNQKEESFLREFLKIVCG